MNPRQKKLWDEAMDDIACSLSDLYIELQRSENMVCPKCKRAFKYESEMVFCPYCGLELGMYVDLETGEEL